MKKIIRLILIILLFFTLSIFISNIFGVNYGISKNWIVRNARIKCNIDSSWSLIHKNDYDMSVLLFYSPDKNEGVTVIYSRMRSSFGYFFKGSEILLLMELKQT